MNILDSYMKSLFYRNNSLWYYDIDMMSDEMKGLLLERILNKVFMFLSEEEIICIEDMIDKDVNAQEIFDFIKSSVPDIDLIIREILENFENE